MKIKKNRGFSDKAIQTLVSNTAVTNIKNLDISDKEIFADIIDQKNIDIGSDYRFYRYWKDAEYIDPTSTYLEYDHASKLLGTMSFKEFKGF
jgi:hypothetical protein